MCLYSLLNFKGVPPTSSEITKFKIEEAEVSNTTEGYVKYYAEERSSLDSTKNAPEEVGFDTEQKEENDSDDPTVDTMTPAEAIFSQNNDMHATNSVKVSCLITLRNTEQVSSS